MQFKKNGGKFSFWKKTISGGVGAITGASRWLLTPTGTLRTSWGYKGLEQNSDGGGNILTKKGEVPLFGQYFFHLTPPGKILTEDHQNSVNSHNFCRGECNPLFGQYFCPPPLWSLIWSIYYPPFPIMVNISSVDDCYLLHPYFGQYLLVKIARFGVMDKILVSK